MTSRTDRIFATLRPTVPIDEADNQALREAIRKEPDGSQEELRDLARQLSHWRRASALPVFPGERLLGSVLMEAMRPSVEAVRTQPFGSPKPPFRSQPEAARWIERAAKAQQGLPKDHVARWHALRPRFLRLIKKLEEVTGANWTVKSSVIVLPYVKPGQSTVINIFAARGSPLATLAGNASMLSKATGIIEALLVSHILTGQRVTRDAVSYTTIFSTAALPAGGFLQRNEVHLEVRSADVNEKQWRRIAKLIRQELGGGERLKQPSAKAWKLWKVVERIGGDPTSFAVSDWERVRRRCAKKGIEYKTWRGPKIMYQRTRKRLGK